MLTDELIKQASNHIRAAKQLTVLTGAGVSKESGVPTFRDALDGLWAQYDPQQLATPSAFLENPKLVWDWYEYRRGMVRAAQPNPGHLALAELEQRYPTMQIITQNVDDLHERAGSKNLIRLHGNIAATRCFYNCQGSPTRVDISKLNWDAASGPPPCPYCGRHLRPDVVWFGEMLPADQIQAARDVLSRTDVMLVVGTSGVVSPAADMPDLAKRFGAMVIEINPVESMVTSIADLWLAAPSGEALPRLVAALNESAT